MTTALAVQTNGVPTASTGRVQLGGASAMAQTIEDLNTIREFVASAMVKDLDYGVIPGTGSKATLLQPGAQKILMYLNCYPDYEVEPRELEGGHVEYIVKTMLRSRTSQAMVGSGIGSCSTMEAKYRWRKGGRVCPKCGSDAIINGKAEYGGGFICFGKKGGCGAKFAEGDAAITSQAMGRVENPDIYDTRNTVLKMAKKRSLVDSAHGLGCMSELFTQDLEDFATEHHEPPSRPEPVRDTSAPASMKEAQRFNDRVVSYCNAVNAKWIDKHQGLDGEIPSWVKDLVSPHQLVNHMLKKAGVSLPEGGKFNERMRAAAAIWLQDEAGTLAEWKEYVGSLAAKAIATAPVSTIPANDVVPSRQHPGDDESNPLTSPVREPGCDDDQGDDR